MESATCNAVRTQPISKIIEARNRFQEQTGMYEALSDFIRKIWCLSIEKQGELTEVVQVLVDKTVDPNEQSKASEHIETFLNDCDKLLNGEYNSIKKVLQVIALSAAVIFLAGLMGFVIGYSLGAWSGPGAFFTGLAAGTVCAVAVAIGASLLGLGGMGYSAYRLFTPSPIEASLHEIGVQAAAYRI